MCGQFVSSLHARRQQRVTSVADEPVKTLESGESVQYVAELLSDREDTVVETYAHLTPRRLSSAPGGNRPPALRSGAVASGSVVVQVVLSVEHGTVEGTLVVVTIARALLGL